MCQRFWVWATSFFEEGYILPRYMIALRWLLFPIDTFYWVYSGRVGYQWQSDTWLIQGNTFSSRALWHLANDIGHRLEVVKNEDGKIFIKRLDDMI